MEIQLFLHYTEVGLCHNSVVSANSMSCNGPPRIFENVLIIKTKKHGGPGRFDNWITFGRQKALIDTQLLIQI